MPLLTQQQIQQLKQEFPNLKFRINYPLSKITYFKVGGPADAYVVVEKRDQLIDLIKYCRLHDIRFTLLGGASNVVVSDGGIKGLVIAPRHNQVEVLEKDDNYAVLRAEVGIKTAALVKRTADFGLIGLGPFLGVPGYLGGAIYNNSHFQTELIGDYVKQVEVLTASNDIVWLRQDECQFAYDSSRFQETNDIILRVDFNLQIGDSGQVAKTMKGSTLYRIKTQPLGMPSSGCIFKNVPNNPELKKRFPKFADKDFISAGFLIDQAGLKGLKQGGVKVSNKHAAFMVNTGEGTANDILKLIDQVKDRVKDKFGIELEEEVFVLE
jgi:UDP-N-acetylmuramate dehydrogenase